MPICQLDLGLLQGPGILGDGVGWLQVTFFWHVYGSQYVTVYFEWQCVRLAISLMTLDVDVASDTVGRFLFGFCSIKHLRCWTSCKTLG